MVRLRLREVENKRAQELKKMLKKYDKNSSGLLEPNEVKEVLKHFNSKEPEPDELVYIMKLCDTEPHDGAFNCVELGHAVEAWRVYCLKRPEMEEAFNKFDTSGSGKLEKSELKAYLVHLNDGIDVEDDEVDWVMAQADMFVTDGACTKPELVMAVAAWYTHVQEKEQSRACSIL